MSTPRPTNERAPTAETFETALKFNPFHDPENGQFGTSGQSATHAAAAIASDVANSYGATARTSGEHALARDAHLRAQRLHDVAGNTSQAQHHQDAAAKHAVQVTTVNPDTRQVTTTYRSALASDPSFDPRASLETQTLFTHKAIARAYDERLAASTFGSRRKKSDATRL